MYDQRKPLTSERSLPIPGRPDIETLLESIRGAVTLDDVKTEYAHDHVPIHESLLEVLLAWSEQCPETDEG